VWALLPRDHFHRNGMQQTMVCTASDIKPRVKNVTSHTGCFLNLLAKNNTLGQGACGNEASNIDLGFDANPPLFERECP
jgi:hypothetical protein